MVEPANEREYINSPLLGRSKILSGLDQQVLDRITVESPVAVFQSLNILMNGRGLCLQISFIRNKDGDKRMQVVEIKECYHSCPFFSLEGGPGPVMYCAHPYWEGKGMESSFIIDHENSHGRVPDECPLRLKSLQVEYKLKEKNEVL